MARLIKDDPTIFSDPKETDFPKLSLSSTNRIRNEIFSLKLESHLGGTMGSFLLQIVVTSSNWLILNSKWSNVKFLP